MTATYAKPRITFTYSSPNGDHSGYKSAYVPTTEHGTVKTNTYERDSFSNVPVSNFEPNGTTSNAKPEPAKTSVAANEENKK